MFDPIDTSPRDGSKFLAHWPEGERLGSGWIGDWRITRYHHDYDDNAELFISDCGHIADKGDGDAPTYWKPIPPST